MVKGDVISREDKDATTTRVFVYVVDRRASVMVKPIEDMGEGDVGAINSVPYSLYDPTSTA
jgi:hypothetical protein